MYNGIGLATPRGSGTNGHVQRNWAVVKPLNREKTYKTEQELAALDSASNRQPNKEILDHERKRKIELKCAEFADILEEQGFNEEVINNKVNNYRNMLIGHEGKLDKPVDQWGRSCVTETHQVAEAQQEKNARLREAFGISEYFVEGSSFDPDRQAKEKLAKSVAIQEKEKQKAVEQAKDQQNTQTTRYQLLHTPSPEPLSPVEKDVNSKKKKRTRRDSSSSEEPKKKKKKRSKKKDRSSKSKDKKKKKKHRRDESSVDTPSSSENEESSSENERKKKKNKNEKRKISKKKRCSSSDSSRESSPEPNKKYKVDKTHKNNKCKERSKKDKQRESKKEKYDYKLSHSTKDRPSSEPDEKSSKRNTPTSPSSKSSKKNNTYKSSSLGRYSKEQKYKESSRSRKLPDGKSSTEKTKDLQSRSLERRQKSRTRSPVFRQGIRKSRSRSIDQREMPKKDTRKSIERSRRSRSRSLGHKHRYRKDKSLSTERKARDNRSKSPDKKRPQSDSVEKSRSRYDKYSEKDIQKNIVTPERKKRQSKSPENRKKKQHSTKYEYRKSKSLSPSIDGNSQSPHRRKYSSKRGHSPRTNLSPKTRSSSQNHRENEYALQQTILALLNPDRAAELKAKSPKRDRYGSCSPKVDRYNNLQENSQSPKYVKNDKSFHNKSKSPCANKNDSKTSRTGHRSRIENSPTPKPYKSRERSTDGRNSPTTKLHKSSERSTDERNRRTSRERSSERQISNNISRRETFERSRTPDVKYKPIKSPERSLKSESSTPDLAKISKQKKESSEKLSTSNKPLPVVRLRASSSEGEPSANEYEKDDEVEDKELRMLRLLKSDLAAKAKETLERKKENPPSPKPIIKRNIEPDLFDIKVLPLKINKDDSLPSISKDDFDIEREGGTSTSRSRPKSKYTKSRKSTSKSRSSSGSSVSVNGSRRSNSSSSSNSSRSRSRSHSRSSTTSSSSSSTSTSRSRSPSIPRRHGSPSFLDRRRITRHK